MTRELSVSRRRIAPAFLAQQCLKLCLVWKLLASKRSCCRLGVKCSYSLIWFTAKCGAIPRSLGSFVARRFDNTSSLASRRTNLHTMASGLFDAWRDGTLWAMSISCSETLAAPILEKSLRQSGLVVASGDSCSVLWGTLVILTLYW